MANANYRPKRLKIVSMGVGLSDETNDNMNLTSTQHLIVGESLIRTGSNVAKTYGLIVDKQGIAVNTTLEDRAAQSNLYSAFLEGNVFVSGTITAKNVVLEGGGNIGIGGGNSYAGSNFWIQSSGDRDSIFFPGRITFGNRGNNVMARNNTHALNITESADRTIDHAQIAVQNTQLSEFRMGIIGTSNISPAIINTTPGTPLEFHAARAQTYFSNVYRRYAYENGSQVVVLDEVPHYTDIASQPHMIIDTDGTVGVHIGTINPIVAQQSRPVVTPSNMEFPLITEKMALHVNGPMFASNVLIWDHQTDSVINIDRLYTRRYGATFEANQIIAGSFQPAPYTFPDKLTVGPGAPDSNYELTVTGSELVTEYFKVDGLTNLNKVEIENVVLLDVASFCNDIYANRDVIIKESLRLRGNMFVQVPIGDTLTWCNVQFQLADRSLSNINYFGAGLSTPGRFGVGISPGFDEVNNQLVVTKRSGDIYELELYDKSSPTLGKQAFIGHPLTGNDRPNDASLVFSTPDPFSEHNLRGVPAPQNFYFFPGASFASRTEPIVRTANPPVLNVDTRSRIGVLTYDPLTELDVRGNIAFTGDLYHIDNNTREINSNTPKIGTWLEKTYASPSPEQGTNLTFRGLEYFKMDTSNLGINRQADARYGVAIKGGLKADAYYTADDFPIADWVRCHDGLVIDQNDPNNSGAMCTMLGVGVGITSPGGATMVLKNPHNANTILRLYRGDDVTNTTSIELGGIHNPWIIAGNDAQHRLEIGFGSNAAGSEADPAAKRAMWMRYNADLNKQQVVLGGDLGVFDAGRSNPDVNASVTVDGNLSVIGDVRVSGHYYMEGNLFVNSNLLGDFQLPANTDDVVLAGNIISLNPLDVTVAGITTYGFVGVGLDAYSIANERNSMDKTPFRVVQQDQNTSTIARFQAKGQNALVDIVNQSGEKLRFGVYQGDSFSFLDKNDRSYLAFTNDILSGTNFLALNRTTGKPVTASLHIHNSSTGNNMLRLTRYGVGNSVGAAPELELEKSVIIGAVNQTTRWAIHGPDAFGEKLAFIYSEGELGSVTADTTRREVFTITKDGCVGIGNSEPEYAIDIVGTEKKGSIRMLNVGTEPTPQLIFQTDAATFGSDASTDFRFYASNNSFIIDSENSTDGYRQFLHLGSNGHIGLLTSPDDRFDVNVGGTINVLNSIYLDGSPVFSTDAASATQSSFNIQATNIFMKPVPSAYGGVTVNSATPSSNLFHINSGRDGTMMVLDSIYERSMLHFRTQRGWGSTTYDRYQCGMSNTSFMLSFASNTGRATSYMPDDEAGFNRFITIAPAPAPLDQSRPVIRLGGVPTDINSINAFTAPTQEAGGGIVEIGNVTVSANLNRSTPGASPLAPSTLLVTQRSNLPVLHAQPAFQTTAVAQFVGHQQPALSLANLATNTLTGTVASPTADLLQWASYSNASTTTLGVISASGNLGIGTTMPRVPLHIIGAAPGTLSPASNMVTSLCVESGNIQVPRVTLTSPSNSVFIESPSSTVGVGSALTSDSMGLFTSNVERIRISSRGNVGVGTTLPTAILDIYGSNLTGSSASASIFKVSSSNLAVPSIRVTSNGNVGIGMSSDPQSALHVTGTLTMEGDMIPAMPQTYDIGKANARWRDLYLSGNTIDLGGTKLTRDAGSGNVRLAATTDNTLRAIITDSIVFGDPSDPRTVSISAMNTSNAGPALQFLITDNVTQAVTELEPLYNKKDDGSGNGGIAVGVPSPDAALHVHGTDTRPALLVDHPSTGNTFLFQARVDATTPLFSILQDGTVGVGTTDTSNTALVVSYSNLVPASVATFNQTGSGNLLVLTNTSGIQFIADANGNVGIGSTIPRMRLDVEGSAAVSGELIVGSNVSITGDLDVSADIHTRGNLVATSDGRVKADLHRIEGALDKVTQLTGYTYSRTDQIPSEPRRETGLIAQDVAKVLPEAVQSTSDGTLGIAYGNMMGLIIEAIKELRSEVDNLKRKVGV